MSKSHYFDPSPATPSRPSAVPLVLPDVTLALRTGDTIGLPKASKREVADRIFDEILKLRLALHSLDGR